MTANVNIIGSSRKVRDRDGEKPNKNEEEMIVSIAIDQAIFLILNLCVHRTHCFFLQNVCIYNLFLWAGAWLPSPALVPLFVPSTGWYHLGWSVTNLCDVATYCDQIAQNGTSWDTPGPIRIRYAPSQNPWNHWISGVFCFALGMAQSSQAKVLSRVFTAKCSEPQAAASNDRRGGSGVAYPSNKRYDNEHSNTCSDIVLMLVWINIFVTFSGLWSNFHALPLFFSPQPLSDRSICWFVEVQ